ncbi:SDR family NAD(P)-dependent oxidoreductase [bacterium]|nr:SDR family NAD(P)-dependent oxidoreductase [bacterium]
MFCRSFVYPLSDQTCHGFLFDGSCLLTNDSVGNRRSIAMAWTRMMMTMVKAALPAMKAAKFGRIVGVSSRGALGLATRTSYAATKAGMLGMLRTWALELGPHGITSNCVAPGPIESEKLADGVYRIKSAYNSLAVEFADHVVLFEPGPQNLARAEQSVAGQPLRLHPRLKPFRRRVEISRHGSRHGLSQNGLSAL